MEIIAELFAAIFAALAEVVFVFLQAVALLLAAVFEFIFLSLTQGKAAAAEQFQKRKQEREARVEQQNRLREEKRNKRTETAETTSATPSITPTQYTILGSLAFIIITGLIISWVVLDRIQQQRLAATRSQVKQLADKFAEQIKDRQIADPVTGRLRDRDAWKQPIDLSVDKTLIGSLVVVRSAGPDRKPGSIDDLLAIRTVPAPAKEVGGELAKRGMKAVRNRIADWLPGGKQEQQPEKTDDAAE